MSTKDLSFEEKVEDYRRRLAGSEVPFDLRGSSLSGGTFSSAGGKPFDPSLDEPNRLAAFPSHTRAFSPSKYSRNVQSADSTLIEGTLSPTSYLHTASPRFTDNPNPPFVSDYVAFGREKDSFSREKPAESDSFRESRSQISALKLENTELRNQLQEAIRINQAAEMRQNQLIRELDDIRNKHSTAEITEIRKEIALKNREIESLKTNFLALERQNRELKEDLLSGKKEKMKILRELDQGKNVENALKRDLQSLMSENEKLRSELLNSSHKISENQENLEQLRLENEALLAELRDSPIETLQNRVLELEMAVKQYQKDPVSLQKPRLYSKKRVNSRHKSEDARIMTTATQRKVMRDVMEVLGVESYGEVVSTVKGLVRKGKTMDAAAEFIEKINEIVVRYSPPGAFVKPPSLKQVWKWVSRLIDEYMCLRKAHDSHAVDTRVLADIAASMGVSHYSQLPRAIDALQRAVKAM